MSSTSNMHNGLLTLQMYANDDGDGRANYVDPNRFATLRPVKWRNCRRDYRWDWFCPLVGRSSSDHGHLSLLVVISAVPAQLSLRS